MNKQTGARVDQCIQESKEFARKCSDWRNYIIRQDKIRYDYDSDNVLSITDPKNLLQWFQSLINPAAAIAQNSKSSKSSTSKIQRHETEEGSAGCCACLSKWVQRRSSDKRKEHEAKGQTFDRKDSFLLGYSGDMEIEVDIIADEMPRFEIKFSAECSMRSKDGYPGLYSWPRKGMNVPDLYLGEFRDGAN
jgi:hypothetical protein